MANYCDYKGIIKGPKNACYGAFGCLEAYDDKQIVQGSGTPENYTLRFEGNCKWSMQHYAKPWTGSWQYQIPEDPMDALMYAEENHDLRLADISRLYQVELLCNWGAFETDNRTTFEHYVLGKKVISYCPDDLRFPEETRWVSAALIRGMDDPDHLAHLSYMNVRGKIFAETGFSKTEREPFRKAIEERGGTLANGMPLDTYCLIVNPAYPEKTEKYENAVGYGYYILTPEMFWKLLEQPQKSIEYPTENDVQITLCTRYIEPQRILMDVPADTVSFDLSKFPIDSVNDRAFASCTKLKEITLADFRIECDFENCPLERIISAKPATLRRKMFRNGIFPELQMPLGTPDDYAYVDSGFIACARFIQEYHAKSEEAMQVKPAYDEYLKKDKKRALVSDDCLVIGRYMLEDMDENILSDGDLSILRMRALKSGDEAFAAQLADTMGNPALKDPEWLIKAEKGKVRIRKYKGHEAEIAVPNTMKGLPVTEIEADAFSPEAPGLTDKMRASRRGLKLVVLPKYLERLDKDAFRGCMNLKQIVYPEGFPEKDKV
mgnify:FL=1